MKQVVQLRWDNSGALSGVPLPLPLSGIASASRRATVMLAAWQLSWAALRHSDCGRTTAPAEGCEPLGGNEPVARPASSYAAVIDLLRLPVQSAAEVVNYVRRADVEASRPSVGRWRRWRARTRARRPGRARIEFREWVGLPWRDRPDEARIADVAGRIARTIAHHPAWRHDILAGQRAQFDPARESADIACAAYRLFLLRREIGPPPDGPELQPNGPGLQPDGPGPQTFGAEPQPPDARAARAAGAAWAERMDSWRVAWESLVDRVAALLDYKLHLDGLAPALAASDTARRLDSAPILTAETAAFTGSAANHLKADEIRALGAGVDGVRESLAPGRAATATPTTTATPIHPQPGEAPALPGEAPALPSPQAAAPHPPPAPPSEEAP